MSDFKNWQDWCAYRDSRNANKARDGFQGWVKGPFPPKDRRSVFGKHSTTGSRNAPAGSKLERKAAESRVGARTVGIVTTSYENIAKGRRLAG